VDDMGKLRCKCGYVMSDVSSPNVFQNWMVSDFQLENLPDELDSGDIMDNSTEVWKCCECGRLTFIEDNFVVNVYKLEEVWEDGVQRK